MSHFYKKTIKMFLIDGEATGRMSVELSNWTGKAYKIPRSKIKISKDRPELNGTGVYILFGEDEEKNEQAYIGEAEDVLKRLNDHLANKEFWTEVVILISKDDNLNKAHIKYIEHQFYQLAKKADRYILKNETTPALSSISESDEAEMEEFISNGILLISTLGYKLFEEKISGNRSYIDDNKVFHIEAARGASASMIQTNEGFVVLKNSIFANPTVDSFPNSFKKLREKLIENSILKFDEDQLKLQDEYQFSSPSTAASLVMGRSANGLSEWKLRNGTTLKEVESIQE